MIRSQFQFNKTIVTLIAIFALVGCSGGAEDIPDLGQVTGTITLDGKPVEGANVTFTPPAAGKKSRGKSSIGTTDAQGKYTLMYSAGVAGAVIADHKIEISKVEGEGEALDVGEEQIPKKYNEDSKLTKTVVEGENTFDFDLKSK